ncbi:MAG: hypothetical protein IIB77_15170 [Proteobacteria bacterium]|nr:hypothetical protein [Pseudomonadota bacterium]
MSASAISQVMLLAWFTDGHQESISSQGSMLAPAGKTVREIPLLGEISAV